MTLKKIGIWVAVAFAAWWVIQQPHAAAAAVHHLGAIAGKAATGLGTFASSL